MSFLSRLSLANRGLTALIAVIITGFGLFVIPQLKQQLFPSLDFPAAFVSAPYPGAAPEVVAAQVTEPIENALQGTPGLERMTSTSVEGMASVQVEFAFGTDLDDATSKMDQALNRIATTLPAGVDPQVFAFRTDNFPVVILGASNGGDERELADKLTKDVLPAIQGIDGVREASLTGAREQQLVITPDPAKLGASGLTVPELMNVLRVNGIAMPAGAVPQDDKTLTVSVGTPITTVDQIRELWLRPTAGPPVQLGSVATVAEQLAPATAITRTNGKSSLGIIVFAVPDGNVVGISHEISDMLPELREMLGSGAELNAVFDQAPYVEKSIEGLTTEGLLGLVMAVIVILVFLLSIRSTIVTAVSIPLSVVVALIEGGRRRLRPILMTAVATIFALLPMALGITGQGGFISQPLAVVVIGGLLSWTVLTLIVVPTLYSIVVGRKERKAAKQAMNAGTEPSDGAGPHRLAEALPLQR